MATVKELNDAFRTRFDRNLGRVVLTRGVSAWGITQELCRRVRGFSDFTPENDPNGEHDFGAFEVGKQRFFWKIDYYDENMEYGSKDPSDPSKTMRVLTIMLAEEY
jgi:hypothetical protein